MGRSILPDYVVDLEVQVIGLSFGILVLVVSILFLLNCSAPLKCLNPNTIMYLVVTCQFGGYLVSSPSVFTRMTEGCLQDCSHHCCSLIMFPACRISLWPLHTRTSIRFISIVLQLPSL